MIDLSRIQDHPNVAPQERWVDDLSELYGRTKAAQAQAEQCGFEGMAAALADMAAALAREPGVDPTRVWALADASSRRRTGTQGSSEPHGRLVTRH